MRVRKVIVPLADHAYPIVIGDDIRAHVRNHLPAFEVKHAFIISDRKLTKARKLFVRALTQDGWSVVEFPVRAGEPLKEIGAIFPLYGKLLKAGAGRQSVLFALGGGSVGDAAGFIAATYLRGISWVGVPTTLLAQVDSSIGGKTGINHATGKNLIGSFHQPAAVLCDIQFLKTLTEREVISGLGEALKYGLIYDPAFFHWLHKNWQRVLDRDPQILIQMVTTCAQWKAKIVAQDEFDRTGLRESLNFGHTAGHALETLTGYKIFQHGEAVIWGMRFALALSFVRSSLDASTYVQTDSLLEKIPVPKWPSRLSFRQLIGPFKMDKKNRGGKLNFVLLKKLGRSYSDNQVSDQDLVWAFQLLTKRRR